VKKSDIRKKETQVTARFFTHINYICSLIRSRNAPNFFGKKGKGEWGDRLIQLRQIQWSDKFRRTKWSDRQNGLTTNSAKCHSSFQNGPTDRMV